MYDYLIVGAGLYGAVFAHEAKKAGKKFPAHFMPVSTVSGSMTSAADWESVKLLSVWS